jgi:hypothetical protein
MTVAWCFQASSVQRGLPILKEGLHEGRPRGEGRGEGKREKVALRIIRGGGLTEGISGMRILGEGFGEDVSENGVKETSRHKRSSWTILN